MAVKEFEELEVWKLAGDLTNQVYEVSKRGNFAKDYVLRDQVRRAAISVMSNIAEGFERGGNQEFVHFLSIAKGSCGEARTQMHIALDQRYVDKKNAQPLIDSFRRLSVMLNNFMVYLKGSKYKGLKFKKEISN